MKIPSKINVYANGLYVLVQDHISNYFGITLAKKIPKGDEDLYIEYTNLSSVWHDAQVEKQPQKVCGNNPVLVVGLRKGRISYKYLWTDMEDLWKDLELLTPSVGGKRLYDKVLWAYLKDVVPYLEIEF